MFKKQFLMNKIDKEELNRFLQIALNEDVKDGDHTSLACVPSDAVGHAKLLVKANGVIAGVQIARAIFEYVDPSIELDIRIKDGEKINFGDVVFYVKGKSQSILKAERLVLNTMQRMSGIATMSASYVEAVKGYNVVVLDTRKTTPMLRFLEKLAVRIGGATNYRLGLYDRIMIKDNHIDFCGSLEAALNKTHLYLKENNLDLKITVEVRDLDELKKVLLCGGIDRIMLDNFSTENMIKAVTMVGSTYELEASGGITLETIRDVAATGVGFISVGALTHSYTSLDLSLKKY